MEWSSEQAEIVCCLKKIIQIRIIAKVNLYIEDTVCSSGDYNLSQR